MSRDSILRSATLHRYATTARTWGALIFIMGLLLLVFPSRVGSALDGLTFSRTFQELIGTGGGVLWKSILLGAVSVFYLLAFWAAQQPLRRLPFALLLGFAATWTLAFTAMAVVHAAAWAMPAVFSALCGLTIWLSRSNPETSNLAIDG